MLRKNRKTYDLRERGTKYSSMCVCVEFMIIFKLFFIFYSNMGFVLVSSNFFFGLYHGRITDFCAKHTHTIEKKKEDEFWRIKAREPGAPLRPAFSVRLAP